MRKRHTLEGPMGGLIGALGGGLIGGGGTLAGMTSMSGLVGSAVGGLLGQTLLGDYGMPSYQQQATAAVPQPLPTPSMPEASAGLPDPTSTAPAMAPGDSPPLTPDEIVRGRANDERKRRGRLSTILTSRRDDEEAERLGG